MKEKLKSNLHYFIPPVIVIIIFGIIMAIKGIYPFGPNVAATLDFDANYVPAYYKLYDILHGTSNIFYDINYGGGLGTYSSLVMNALFSPISWLIFFSSRSNIPNFMSFILV